MLTIPLPPAHPQSCRTRSSAKPPSNSSLLMPTNRLVFFHDRRPPSKETANKISLSLLFFLFATRSFSRCCSFCTEAGSRQNFRPCFLAVQVRIFFSVLPASKWRQPKILRTAPRHLILPAGRGHFRRSTPRFYSISSYIRFRWSPAQAGLREASLCRTLLLEIALLLPDFAKGSFAELAGAHPNCATPRHRTRRRNY